MASLGWLIRNRYTHQRTAKYQHTNFPSIEKDHLSALPIISPFPIKSTPRKAGSDTIESYSKSTRNSVTSNSAYAAVGSLKNPSMITSKSDGDASQIAKMDVRQTSSILSSTDALLIADTFRQFMRKPEWIASEDDGKTKRRSILETDPPQERLGDQLLRKQLEEEGAQVRHVETRSRPVSGLDQIP
ncbi:uncharacterized protein BYT42DRAFT_272259 [Radiomyces spectabilis]|uniref:uncharacterized protein n=1 Tax=Radiomyces spectabilis TaxID=64574 RepID=UPI00221E3B28|nr:uncharacterized protein BYT42DRAFT_272259 [Radiomyces spectabilis]KAI8384728.1 hypothetical protein BYT42DRAFT_272259 [Radiomyces spectabilis]